MQLASRRIRRTKSLAGYTAAVYQDLIDLKARSNYRSIAASAISGDSLAEEIEIFNKSMQSSNYLPGVDGWKIDGSGNAEFGNVYVRGDINAYSGTIGYWNISNPSVERTFGDTTLFGTFLESFDHGFTDEGTTTGSYVSLFKSYVDIPSAITKISVTSDIVTITCPDHNFIVGDKIIIEFDDSAYSAYESNTYLIVTETTLDTFSYVKRVADSGENGNTVVEVEVSGVAQIYNEDVAGLYLRDYSKREFDYGYFSNTGVSYVSAEDINVIKNPSFEYINSSNVLTPDHTTSWTADISLNYNLETFSAPSLSRPYKNNSAYGGRLTWNSGGLSTYLSSTIDYAAGASYKVFSFGRNLYFGATIFPRYTPPIFKTVNLVETATLSNNFTSATATTSTITYTGSGLTFSAGQYVTVSGFSNSRFNITAKKIATANSTTVTVNLEGAAVSTETTTRTATSKLLKVTTSTAHGLSAGETVFLDMDVVYENPVFGGDVTAIYSPHTIADGTQGHTYTVSASPAPSGSIVYLSTEFASMEADGTDLTLVAHVNKNGSSRSLLLWKAYETALDLSAVTISYPNVATTTPIADVLSAGTKALWDAGLGKYLLGTANSYMLGYLDTDVGIAALTNPNEIILDGEKISVAYEAADPVGYAAQSDIKLNFPGWLLIHDGNGVVPASPSKISSAGYIIDNVYLSTASNFFYGSELANNRWYENTENPIPARASIEGTKSWLNINLDNQSASLDYFDYIGFRNNTFSKTMLVRPSLGVYDSTQTYLKFPDSTYETTTLTGGQYQYLTTTQYINVSPSLKLITGDRSTSFELAASTKNINLITGESFISSSAVIAGMYDEQNNQSTIYVGSDKFVWTQYPSTLDNETNASVIFTPALASFAQRIRTNGSISAGAAIYTSAGNIRTYNGDIYTSVGNIYTSSGGFTGDTIRLTSDGDVSLNSTTHGFQIGLTSGINLRIDNNEIQAVNNGAANTLALQASGGNITLGSSTTSTTTISDRLRLTSTENATTTSTLHPLQIGSTTGTNTRFDYNGIQTLTNGATATLTLNGSGGNVWVGSTTSGTVVLRNYSGAGSTTGASIDTTGAIIRTTSSARYKQDIVEANYLYEDILLLAPKQFRLKGEASLNKDSKVYGGFIAEELDQIDSLRPFVNYLILEDGSTVPDGIAYGEMVSVLVSAIKHQDNLIKSLTSRLDALEGN